MTKRALSIPALALSILLFSAVLAPAAFAKSTHSATRSAPAAVAIETAPVGKTVVSLVIATLGVISAVIAGVNAGINGAIGAASTDPAAVTQSESAQAANETATIASAAAAVTNAEATGKGIGTLLASLAAALTGSS
jgi:hypothetical protein